MQFSTAVLSTVLAAALATAAPLEERAGLVTLNLYSDNNCANKVQTLVLQNRTCAATATFSSARVAANAQVAIAEAYNQAGCSNGVTRAWILNNASVCTNNFQSGPAKYIQGFYPSSSS